MKNYWVARRRVWAIRVAARQVAPMSTTPLSAFPPLTTKTPLIAGGGAILTFRLAK